MRRLDDPEGGDLAARFAGQLETALMARALAELGSLPEERVNALLRDWLIGDFNARSSDLDGKGSGRGQLAWEPEQRSGDRLVWTMPSGLACPLARLYPQENGTWAALVVAGVRDGLIEAMAAAEWGVPRLTSL